MTMSQARLQMPLSIQLQALQIALIVGTASPLIVMHGAATELIHHFFDSKACLLALLCFGFGFLYLG